MKLTKIELTRVNIGIKEHAEFLFKILNEREPKNNISNITKTTWREHLKFLDSHPYSDWYIIKSNEEFVGSLYLTHRNEIGIFVRSGYRRKGIGTKAIDLLMKQNPRRFYYGNVNPDNEILVKFFHKIFSPKGFKLVELCYELRGK